MLPRHVQEKCALPEGLLRVSLVLRHATLLYSHNRTPKQAPRETSCFMRACSASRHTQGQPQPDTQASAERNQLLHACLFCVTPHSGTATTGHPSKRREKPAASCVPVLHHATFVQPQPDTQASAEMKTSSCLRAYTFNSLLLQHSSLAATHSQLALL